MKTRRKTNDLMNDVKDMIRSGSGSLLKKSNWCIIAFLFLTTSFRKSIPDTDTTVTIRFVVYVHGVPMQLNKKYSNPFGEIFEISRFRLYAGNLEPVYTDDHPNTNVSSQYHLIDFSDSASTSVELSAAEGSFRGIQFILGIDSTDQVRGAQTGALDPIKGMFWTWNSGYQSFKLEGVSPVSDQPAHMIAYHIGGYRYPYSTVWKIRLSADKIIQLSKNNKIIVEIPIELDYFFDGPHPLHINQISDCMTPGDLARRISENFISSFKGLTIISNP
jgi:hypothetical protein